MVQDKSRETSAVRYADRFDNRTSAARLRALDALALMDTPPEDVFDRAVRLATRLLGTPVGLLSLVDGQRQFFKAEIGLTGAAAQTRETPLTHSFCQHVVEADAPLMVRDAREDAVLRDNLAIEELGVVAYLGVPVHDPNGLVLGSFCAVQSEPRDWTEAEREILADIVAGIESEIALREALSHRAAAEQARDQTERRLRLALRAGGLGTYDFDPKTGTATWDDELFDLWGIPIGTPDPFARAIELIHPDDQPVHEAAFAKAMNPDGDGRYEVELRIQHGQVPGFRWVDAAGDVMFENREPVRLIGTVQDITDRKHSEEQLVLLTQELNHRAKNLFAITVGLVGITARETNDCKEMAEALRSRIISLAAAHDLVRPAITSSDATESDTNMHALAETILGPHIRHSGQIDLNGPHVALDPKRASALALVLHEFATNAVKYGALSAPEGCVCLHWHLSDQALEMRWSERDGPAIEQAPDAKGFGSTLVEMTICRQLLGSYEIDTPPAGLTCVMRLPWDAAA